MPVPARSIAQRSATMLRELMDVSRVLMEARDPERLFQRILESSIALVQAERGFLFSCSAEDPEQRLLVGRGSDGAILQEPEAKISQSVLREVIASGRGVVVADTQADETLSIRQSIVSLNVRSVLCAPLRNAGDVLGALYVDSRMGQAEFGQEDLAFLESFGSLAGAAIANAKAYRTLQEFNTLLEKRVSERTFELRKSEERYAAAARGSNDGLWDWNLETNTIYFSARAATMLGLGNCERTIEPDEWFARVHPTDVSALRRAISEHLDGKTESLTHEYRVEREGGNHAWILCRGAAVGSKDMLARMAGSQTDVTERKSRDPVTGLATLSLLMSRLELAIARAVARGIRFALLSIDFDRHAMVSESMGQSAAEKLMCAAAARFERNVGSSDTLCVAGSRFLVLLEDVGSEKEVTMFAQRFHETVAAPFSIEGHEVFTNARIGIAMSSSGYAQPEEVVRNADTARSRVKEHGHTRHEFFDKESQQRILSFLQTEAELRRAIAEKEFRVFYQPILELKSRCLVGFEALIRWNHPGRGLVPPVQFIPIAEETGLIADIGTWVLREACDQAAKWKRTGLTNSSFTIAVNLSPQQLGGPTLVEVIRDALRQSELDAHSLKLEITESALVDSAAAVIHKLGLLKELKVRLSIDDFGTGYSSLSYLQKFPIDTLKVDRSFVMGLESDPGSREIAKTIIALAHSLNLDVVAEGVENEAQAACLTELGCDYAQGFLFSKPVPADQAAKWFVPPSS